MALEDAVPKAVGLAAAPFDANLPAVEKVAMVAVSGREEEDDDGDPARSLSERGVFPLPRVGVAGPPKSPPDWYEAV